MNASNFKDTLTTICGLVFTVAGSMLALELSPKVKMFAGFAMAISGGIIGWLTGKAPSGAVKTESQVEGQNVKNPKPPMSK